jgi:cytochrome oxidase Cu insertion factor (SCO1/SenC/PrrC family)
MIRSAVVLCSVLAASAAARQPAAPPAPRNLDNVGPQVGVKVVSFTLPDQSGRPRSLESLMGPKGAMLVFFRSADW